MQENLDAHGFNSDNRKTIKTFTNKYVDPWAITEGEVEIQDIAHSNSQDCRFNGHTMTFWSVAQHELLVAYLLIKAGMSKGTAVLGLVHDGSEAYFRDLPSPIKHDERLAAFRAGEKRCSHVVASALGASLDDEDLVKEADIFARRVEQLAFMGSKVDPGTLNPKFDFREARKIIHALATQGPPAIEQIFLELFDRLQGEKKVELWLPTSF